MQAHSPSSSSCRPRPNSRRPFVWRSRRVSVARSPQQAHKKTTLSSSSSLLPANRRAAQRHASSMTTTTMATAVSSPTTTGSSSPPPPCSVVAWLQSPACPLEIVLQVVVLGGPHMLQALSGVDRYWKALAQDDATWKLLGRAYGKWQDDGGGDASSSSSQLPPVPATSWKEVYHDSPLVGVDYPTLAATWEATTSSSSRRNSTSLGHRRIRILLAAHSRHVLQEPLRIPCGVWGKDSKNRVEVSLETLPCRYHARLERNYHQQQQQSSSSPSSSRRRWRRWNCKQTTTTSTSTRNDDDDEQDEDPVNVHEDVEGESQANPADNESSSPLVHRQRLPEMMHNDLFLLQEEEMEESTTTASSSSTANSSSSCCCCSSRMATIVFQTRRHHNAPALCLSHGRFKLSHVSIVHACSGMDIWNGNAALQLQPISPSSSLPDQQQPPPTVECVLEHCTITSASGRGLVCLEGASCQMNQCAVYKCAATGIYMGGANSRLDLVECDVLLNGMGNTASSHSRGAGIARGHSGIYIEQGCATILKSTIGHNSLTGISVVSPQEASLDLQGSELVYNGSYQLEWSSVGQQQQQQNHHERSQRQQLLLDGNVLAVQGPVRLRSGQLDALKVRRGLVRNVLQHMTNEDPAGEAQPNGVGGRVARRQRPVMGPVEAGWQ